MRPLLLNDLGGPTLILRLLAALSLVLAVQTSPHADPGERRFLRVAVDGALDALDAEVLATFAKTQNKVLQPVQGAAASLTRGEADLFAGVYSDAVASPFAASSEVFPSRLMCVTRKPAGRAIAIESLRWSRIGLLRGSRAPVAIRDSKISGAELAEYPALDVALQALRNGQVASLLLELPEALLARKQDAQLELGLSLGSRRSRVYAVRAGDKALLVGLDAYLGSLRSTASWPAIVARHYGPTALEVIAAARLND